MGGPVVQFGSVHFVGVNTSLKITQTTTRTHPDPPYTILSREFEDS